ncbi:MAG: hypothetical protein O3C39_11595 [Planctomycetota bacterium]|nr:hypothetical protein [Planctomycetota bacterium]
MSEPAKTAAGLAVLLAVLALAIGTAWAVGEQSPARWQAIMVAAAAAGSGAAAGWLVTRWSQGRTAATAVAGGLGSTLVRLAPPLAALGWIATSEGSAKEAGAAGLVVIFYVVLLAATLPLIMMDGRKPGLDGRGTTAN